MSGKARCKGRSVPADAKLYASVKAETKRRFKAYPSIYANSWLVREYKQRGGKYRCSGKKRSGGLERWYREKWVDLSRPRPGGGWEPCGRPSVDSRRWRMAYPKCRPEAEARKMSKAEVASAVRRKRSAVHKSKAGKPVYVKTFVGNPGGTPFLLGALVGVALAGAWLLLERGDGR